MADTAPQPGPSSDGQQGGQAPQRRRVFPNPHALLRLAGSVLVQTHDEWKVSDRRYLSEASIALLDPTADRPKQVTTPALLTA
jgi:hypothetical protein